MEFRQLGSSAVHKMALLWPQLFAGLVSIEITKQSYPIDETKIFAVGHSNGAGMTWRLGLDAPEGFSAISPSGYTMGSIPNNAIPERAYAVSTQYKNVFGTFDYTMASAALLFSLCRRTVKNTEHKIICITVEAGVASPIRNRVTSVVLLIK